MRAIFHMSKLIHKNLSKMVIYRTNSKFDLLKNYSRFSSLNKSTFSKIIESLKILNNDWDCNNWLW